jgi:putative membrane protein
LLAAQTTKPNIHIDSGAAQMLKSPDKAFAMNTVQKNLTAIKLVKLAAERSGNAEIKQLATDIAEFRAAMNQKFASLAARDHMTLPQVATAEGQGEYEKLIQLKGAEFEKRYLAWLLKSHQAAIKAFAREAKHGKDPDLKPLVAEALPILDQHLARIKNFHSQV